MTTPPNPNVNENEQEPFFPPHYMLILAAVGLVVAALTYLTQPSFTVIGWGGLGLAILSLLMWGLMAPDQVRGVLTGRTARFGGTSILVTLVFLLALIAIYAVVKQRDIHIDLTEVNEFSLTDDSRTAMATLGADPTTPAIQLIAFYGANQAGRRDQDTVLLEDYVNSSGGKITYEFVDPVRDPVRSELYGVTQPGQIVVVAMNEAGEPDTENAETVSFFQQEDLTNAILRVAASGDFRAYFLNVEEGLTLSTMSLIDGLLRDRLDWTTQEVSLFELTGEQSEIELNDPAADGEVLVVPGGKEPLTDEELAFITDYVDNGGDLVLFADAPLGDTDHSLATAENMSTYLWENFGVRFLNDVILDPTLSLPDSIAYPIAIDFDAGHYITSNFPAGSGMIFGLPHTIEFSDTPPADVTLTRLATSSEAAYAKEDINALLDSGDANQTDEDRRGPFVMAVAAENADSGARVVLFSSPSIIDDNYLGNRIVNLDAALSSLVWTTHFDEFFNQITVDPVANAQDAPVTTDQQTVRNINFVTVLLLPFGVLGIGVLVWWFGRERRGGTVERAAAHE
jgi:hypothetical protein